MANRTEDWDKPDFTREEKPATIAEPPAVVTIKPVSRGIKFYRIASCQFSAEVTRSHNRST